MFNIAICDDEPKILKDLSKEIEAVFSKFNISADFFITENPSLLLDYMNSNSIDILFLDIDMPEISGMKIAEMLLNNGVETLLIFVTNQEALVYKSFQYHPFGFIRKSFFNAEIEQVISNAVDTLSKKKDTISFKSGNEIIRIKLTDIMYFESDLNYINMYTTSTNYHYRETLGALEVNLSAKGFIRIHKGYLVNQLFVFAIRREEIELINGRLLPIGRTSRENVKKQMMRYMR